MTAVTKAQETSISTNVMDDIFDSAGEGASFDSSECRSHSCVCSSLCHHSSARRSLSSSRAPMQVTPSTM